MPIPNSANTIEITSDLITGSHSGIIKNRARKALEQQTERTRQHTEVFTPLWICEKMNDHADSVWFDRNQGIHKTDPETGHIIFTQSRKWRHYVDSRRLEITCGETPYLVSRYDVSTGESISLSQRIGILDKKQRENPVEKQAIFLDTHERIIEDDVFEKVQEIREHRHRQTRTGRSSMFSGLVFCSDCGAKMNFYSTNNYKESGAYFECSEHWNDRSKCKAHYIREAVLERLVLKHMQAVTNHILRYEDHFRKTMLEKQLVEGQNVIQEFRKQLERDEKRISELKRLFIKIYEDNAGG